MTPLSFTAIERLTRYQLGIFDVPCPACGPDCRSPQNRVRKVLRVWRKEPDFVTFKCARCGLEGHTRRDDREASNQAAKISTRPNAAPVSAGPAVQSAKAAAMWRRRRPAAGSPVETYLRQVRGYRGSLPATIGFLPPSKSDHHPAMIAAFGLAAEREPGELAVDEAAITGIHLTLLRADGRGKAGTGRDKIMVGPSAGLPIALSPINDALGLVIAEGIETGLSLAEATGCGVWAAGAAGRMPALADKVPGWIDVVTIAAEPDQAGRKGAANLAARLGARGIWCETRILTGRAEAA